MGKIDRLLYSVKMLIEDNEAAVYMMDDGNFIMALGLDPEQYAAPLSDGRTGYDVVKALNDAAAADWDNWDNWDTALGDDPEEFPEEMPDFDSISLQEAADGPEGIPLPEAITALRCLTRAETEEMLEDDPVIIDGEPRFISYDELKAIADERKPEQKPRKLFGWG